MKLHFGKTAIRFEDLNLTFEESRLDRRSKLMAHCHGHYKWGTFGRMTTDTWIDHMNDYDHNVHDLEDEDSDVESATSEKDPRNPSLGETGSGKGFLDLFYKTMVTLFRS